VLSIFLVLALWFGRFAYLRIALRPTPRTDYWIAQLEALDPAPPGALSTARATALLRNHPWTNAKWSGLYPVTPPRVSFQPEPALLRGEWETSRAEIALATRFFESDEFAKAHAAVTDAARAGWEDLSVEPPFRWGSGYEAWCRWLTYHSRWCIEHLDDTEAAVEDWLTCLRVARQVLRSRQAQDLYPASLSIRIPALEMMRQAGERDLAVPSADLAKRVHAVLGPALAPGELLAGTRIALLARLEAMYVREGGNWLDVSAAVEQISGQWASQWGGGGTPPSRIWNLTSPVFHTHEEAAASVHAFFAQLDQAGRYATWPSAYALSAGLSLGPLDGFSDFHEGQLLHSVDRYYEARTQLEAALTLFALREYQRRHARYPDALDDLVPDHLPDLPVDYADHQPLRYRLTEDGFLLYSIGADRQDNGGSCEHPDRGWSWPNSDVTYQFRARHEQKE
jgi:hypothetical protein